MTWSKPKMILKEKEKETTKGGHSPKVVANPPIRARLGVTLAPTRGGEKNATIQPRLLLPYWTQKTRVGANGIKRHVLLKCTRKMAQECCTLEMTVNLGTLWVETQFVTRTRIVKHQKSIGSWKVRCFVESKSRPILPRDATESVRESFRRKEGGMGKSVPCESFESIIHVIEAPPP